MVQQLGGVRYSNFNPTLPFNRRSPAESAQLAPGQRAENETGRIVPPAADSLGQRRINSKQGIHGFNWPAYGLFWSCSIVSSSSFLAPCRRLRLDLWQRHATVSLLFQPRQLIPAFLPAVFASAPAAVTGQLWTIWFGWIRLGTLQK